MVQGDINTYFLFGKPAFDPGGQSGETVGNGIGRVGGIAVRERPEIIFTSYIFVTIRPTLGSIEPTNLQAMLLYVQEFLTHFKVT